MKTSQNGQFFIKLFEKCRLVPYQDSYDIWTIGWGNTFDLNNKRVTKDTKPVTQAQADELFIKHLAFYEDQINELVVIPRAKARDKNIYPVTQCEFDAMVSCNYNVTNPPFIYSKCKEYIVQCETDLAMQQWNWGIVNKEKGLIKRRESEKRLYLMSKYTYLVGGKEMWAGDLSWEQFLLFYPQYKNM